jgi:hypothetical protein
VSDSWAVGAIAPQLPKPALLRTFTQSLQSSASILTATTAKTVSSDPLINGGSISSMISFADQTDDDILIYGNNGFFAPLGLSATQPITAGKGSTVNSAIVPDPSIAAKDNNLLITPSASPTNPLTSNSLTGVSTSTVL